jgi:hypothetical protein
MSSCRLPHRLERACAINYQLSLTLAVCCIFLQSLANTNASSHNCHISTSGTHGMARLVITS